MTTIKKIHPIRQEIQRLFSLREDKADDADIDASLRSGVVMKGTNLWVLMFAIFIASIGLNVNSTAVIIGAMLISPLMGPIMGIGYGLGIYDFQLIRTALKNLGIAIFISLMTSVIYFLISPLTEAQSELLARTTPTIWDVLIALFGGLAGIVGVTRKEKSNIIPGVAIATALMPPLCTAGYGIANGNLSYFFGAFYLFTINCVFIALSSALIIRAFHVEEKHFVDPNTTRRVKSYALLLAILTVGPSIYLAYNLVQEEVFKSRATQFIDREVASKNIYVTHSKVDSKAKAIEVTIIGEFLNKEKLAAISQKLAKADLRDARLEVHQQADQQTIDVSSLKSGLLNELYTQSQIKLEEKDKQIQQLEEKLSERRKLEQQVKTIPDELKVLFPSMQEMWLSQAMAWNERHGVHSLPTLVLNIQSKRVLTIVEKEKMEQWLKKRLVVDEIKLVFEYPSNRSLNQASAMKRRVSTFH